MPNQWNKNIYSNKKFTDTEIADMMGISLDAVAKMHEKYPDKLMAEREQFIPFDTLAMRLNLEEKTVVTMLNLLREHSVTFSAKGWMPQKVVNEVDHRQSLHPMAVEYFEEQIANRGINARNSDTHNLTAEQVAEITGLDQTVVAGAMKSVQSTSMFFSNTRLPGGCARMTSLVKGVIYLHELALDDFKKYAEKHATRKNAVGATSADFKRFIALVKEKGGTNDDANKIEKKLKYKFYIDTFGKKKSVLVKVGGVFSVNINAMNIFDQVADQVIKKGERE